MSQFAVGPLPRDSRAAFVGVSAVLFVASSVATIVQCTAMSAMGGMTMPGGWTMSMMWMRMPGQTWAGAASSFLVMWAVMMAAMMLPSLVPMLTHYRDSIHGVSESRLALLTTLAGAGYFAVWTALGAIAFPVGLALAELTMRHAALSRAVPFAIAAVVLAAGALQLTAWKRRQLACCRDAPDDDALPAGSVNAWRHGLRLGLRCCRCCAGLTAVMLAAGMMDLRVMAVVTAAVTAERLAPNGERVAQVSGGVLVAAGMLLVMRAGGL